jgi:hypothetical protein
MKCASPVCSIHNCLVAEVCSKVFVIKSKFCPKIVKIAIIIHFVSIGLS